MAIVFYLCVYWILVINCKLASSKTLFSYKVHLTNGTPIHVHYKYIKKRYTLDLRVKCEIWGKYPLGGVKCEMNYQSDVFQNPTTFPLISDRYD